MLRVRHENRVFVGNRSHIYHVHVALCFFEPESLGPFELDDAGQPSFALIRGKNVLHKGDLPRDIERID